LAVPIRSSAGAPFAPSHQMLGSLAKAATEADVNSSGKAGKE
jgi:hypothetical protein